MIKFLLIFADIANNRYSYSKKYNEWARNVCVECREDIALKEPSHIGKTKDAITARGVTTDLP